MKRLRTKKADKPKKPAKAAKQKQPKAPSERRSLIFALYKLLNIALPIALLLLIRGGLSELAIVIALFSKWRVFAVKPRHMLANLRSNATDIIVKVSTLVFIIQAETLTEQIMWTAWYVLWLAVIKPASVKSMVIFQAISGHILGVSALFLLSNNLNEALLISSLWLISLSSARHFLSAYEETRINLLSNIWALFVVQLGWILSQWLLVYVFIPQLVFILIVVGYAVASVYDSSKSGALTKSFIRQQSIMAALIIVLIAFLADWQGVV